MLNLTSSHILYPISKAYIQDSTSYPLDAQRFQSLGILSNGETTEQLDLDTLLRAWEPLWEERFYRLSGKSEDAHTLQFHARGAPVIFSWRASASLPCGWQGSSPQHCL